MAHAMAQYISDNFWSSSFWIEGNATWSDLEAARVSGKAFIAMPRDLLVSFPVAILLFVLRLIWEKFVALPIGRYYNIREKLPQRAVPNTILEKAYVRYGKHPPGYDSLTAIAKQADWNVRQVERWWRRRRTQNAPPEMQKFKETSWRYVFYLVAFWGGLRCLWIKDYFWDTRRCWDDYPFQTVSTDIYWYYMIELGFYWSLILSMFMDIKRKDFVQMVVHHIATIGLMSFSWSNGTCRWGAIVLVTHDAVDYWMEGAKLGKYTKKRWLSELQFVIFTIMWFITRLVIYPWKVIYNSYYESLEIIGHTTNGWVVFYTLLCTLQVLHVIWFCMILRMLYKYVIVGTVEKDDRSESDIDTNTDDELVLSKDLKPPKVGENGSPELAVNNNLKHVKK